MKKEKETRAKKLLTYIAYLAIPIAIPASLLLTSCQTYHKNKKGLDTWVMEEFGEYKTRDDNPKKFKSTNPQDFIHSDGLATAIPAKVDWDLYISPYATDKYIRSREPEGSTVICPYSGKPLLLGHRSELIEIDPR